MPLSDQAIVQVATGSTGSTDASTSYVILPTPASAGNVVLMSAAISFASITDYVYPNQSSGHPTPNEATAFTGSPVLKPDCPRVQCFGTYLLADNDTWQFDWIRASDTAPQATGVAWTAVELQGLTPFYPSGPPGPPVIPWEPTGSSYWWYEGGVATVADSGDYGASQCAFGVFYLASFAAWVSTSRPPEVVDLVESTNTAWGGWTPLAPNVRTTNVSTPNVGLDCAYKIAYGSGQFDCQATYGQAPGGIALIKDAFVADYLAPQRTGYRAAVQGSIG